MSILPISEVDALCKNISQMHLTNNSTKPPTKKVVLLFPESTKSLTSYNFWQVVEKALALHPQATEINITGLNIYNKKIFQIFLKHTITIEAIKISEYVTKFEQLGLSVTRHGDVFTRTHIAAITDLESILPDTVTKDELNTPDPKGRSALHICVLQKHFNTARRLVALGADPELPTLLHGTPEGIAAQMQLKNFTDIFFCKKPLPLLATNCYSQYQVSALNGFHRQFRIEEVAPAIFATQHPRNINSDSNFEGMLNQAPSWRNLLVSYYEYETLIRSLCHSCDIPMSFDLGDRGILSQRIYYRNQDQSLCFKVITGGFASFFLHEMAKATHSFIQLYPANQICYEHKALKRLYEALVFASDQGKKTAYQIIERCKSNEPTFISIKFDNPSHSVMVVIWCNHFIICNRGDASRKPVEVYTFKQEKLSQAIIMGMLSQFSSSKEYQDYFFTILPQQLQFHQTPLELALEKAFTLPMQVTENCSWKSSETCAYCFFTLSLLEEKRLLYPDVRFQQKATTYLIAADSFFKNWLYYQQLCYMKEYVEKATVKDSCFFSNFTLLPSLRKQIDQIKRFLSLHPQIKQKALALEIQVMTLCSY